MRKLFTSLLLLSAVTAGFGQFTISKVSTNPVSPATLQPGTNVTVSFSYTKPAGNVRIYVRPMFRNALAANYGASGGALYTTNSGSGTSDFTINGVGNVDQVRFQFTDATLGTVLNETFVDVSFRFVYYDISSVVFTPASPATVPVSQNINLTYDYFKPAGNVRIYLMPMIGGNVASGYGVPGSPLYSALTGSVAGFVSMNLPSAVDQIRFQIIDAANQTVLYEEFVSVDFHWVNYEITNVVLNPVTPAEILVGNNVKANFNYSKPDGNVRIFVRPMFGGTLAPNYGADGAALYTTNTGSGSSGFTLMGPGSIDQIRFQFEDASTSVVLAQIFVPVSYNFVNYQFSNVVFTPPSPAVLAPHAPVNISFSYAKVPGDVRIYAMPMIGGVEAPGFAVDGSPLYTANTGTGASSVSLTAPGNADQIRLQITDPGGTTVLFQQFYPVNYSWKNYAITDVVFTPASPKVLAINQQVGVAFNYSKPDGDIRIFVLGYLGGVFVNDYSYQGSPLYSTNSGSGSSFFLLMAPGKIDEVRFLITDNSGTVTLATVSLPVDYTWTNYSLSNVKFTPASPASLQPTQNVTTTFDYGKPDGEIRIFLTPYYNGSPATGYAVSPSPLYTANTGSGTGTFTLNLDGLVDQVRISITDNTVAQNLLHEEFFTVAYTFKNTSGIDNQSIAKKLSIYPIPCTDKFNLVYPADETFQYRVYNLQGSLMIEGTANSGVVEVNAAGLPAGSYLVKVLTSGNVMTKIMVKQ